MAHTKINSSIQELNWGKILLLNWSVGGSVDLHIYICIYFERTWSSANYYTLKICLQSPIEIIILSVGHISGSRTKNARLPPYWSNLERNR